MKNALRIAFKWLPLISLVIGGGTCTPSPLYHHRQGNLSTTQKSAHSETGIASFYGPEFSGRKTASGEIFDPEAFTAAHRTLPFGTLVRVTHLNNNRSVEVRINDRGPFIKGRIIDLSPAAARQLDMIRSGTARVRITVIQKKP